MREFGTLKVRLKVNTGLITLKPEGWDPSEFLHECEGTIHYREDDVDADAPLKNIGKIRVITMQLDLAEEARINGLEIADSHTQETSDCGQAVFTPKGDWSRAIKAMFPDTHHSRVLLLSRVEILERYRGRNFGLIAAKCAIDFFCSFTHLVVLKPYPIQYEKLFQDPLLDHSQLDRKFKKDREKLREYWSKLGVRRIGRSDFYAMSTANRMPSYLEMWNSMGKTSKLPRSSTGKQK